MAFHYLLLFALLNLRLQCSAQRYLLGAGSHGAVPEEDYWKSVFPNTPMPKALRDLLPLAASGTKNMLADMVKDDKKPTDGFGNYAYSDPSKEFKGSKNMLGDMVKNNDKVVDDRANYGYGNPSKEFADGNAPTNKDVYFFESELHPGRTMILKDLTKKASKATFLPRSVAESIPFSTQKIPEILKYFSLEAKSAEANLLKETIENCERPALGGEEKYCAKSFESFVDLGVSKLGKNIQLLSNELEKETQNQEFTIGQGVKMMGESEIVCHKMKYAYAVFLCHSIDKTAVYTVPLVGADGTRARGLAVCHKDTSTWNPKHLAFQILKVKPGTVPICHFLVRETLVWLPN
ncbi:BURP domain protein RD22-like isoform X2 [Durio zibethinus]|uniref:BURP domain protein RD22-like isoform X2 n=1 Tax=Durio zibethinus TaxID=66656 RepID=A0A6P5ZMC2_DURZI|nr:BURP domain protein RD22-like isoform X2 [Durio zibethinus]